MRPPAALCSVVICMVATGCSISQGPAATSSPSPVVGVSLLTSPVPSPALDPAWTLHPNPAEGYTIGFPDTWNFVFKNSPTFDGDMKALNNADLIKFFGDGFKSGSSGGLNLIAAEPRSAQSGFVTNLSVFRLDLGPAGTAPSLDSIASSKVTLFSKDQAITGDVKRQQVQLPAGTVEQLQYSMKPADKTVVVSTYLGTTEADGHGYLLEIVIGTNVQDYAGLFDRISKSFRLLQPDLAAASPAASTPAAPLADPSPRPS